MGPNEDLMLQVIDKVKEENFRRDGTFPTHSERGQRSCIPATCRVCAWPGKPNLGGAYTLI